MIVCLIGAGRILKAVSVIIFLTAEDAEHIFRSDGPFEFPVLRRCVLFSSVFTG